MVTLVGTLPVITAELVVAPSAPLFWALTMPALTVTRFRLVLLPLRNKVAVPFLVRLTAVPPVKAPLKVVLSLTVIAIVVPLVDRLAPVAVNVRGLPLPPMATE